jgi:hypothetical protein
MIESRLHSQAIVSVRPGLLSIFSDFSDPMQCNGRWFHRLATVSALSACCWNGRMGQILCKGAKMN